MEATAMEGVNFSWWLQVVEVPVALGMVYWIRTVQRDLHELTSRLGSELAEFKVTVARDYISEPRLRDVEDRILESLTRIEDRLNAFVSRQTGGGS